ncbi:MAG: hypothetical protein ACI8XD_001247 [Thermoproteota archaeon]
MSLCQQVTDIALRLVLAWLGLPGNLFAFDSDRQLVVDKPVCIRLFAGLPNPVVLTEQGVPNPVLFVDA